MPTWMLSFKGELSQGRVERIVVVLGNKKTRPDLLDLGGYMLVPAMTFWQTGPCRPLADSRMLILFAI